MQNKGMESETTSVALEKLRKALLNCLLDCYCLSSIQCESVWKALQEKFVVWVRYPVYALAWKKIFLNLTGKLITLLGQASDRSDALSPASKLPEFLRVWDFCFHIVGNPFEDPEFPCFQEIVSTAFQSLDLFLQEYEKPHVMTKAEKRKNNRAHFSFLKSLLARRKHNVLVDTICPEATRFSKCLVHGFLKHAS